MHKRITLGLAKYGKEIVTINNYNIVVLLFQLDVINLALIVILYFNSNYHQRFGAGRFSNTRTSPSRQRCTPFYRNLKSKK
jgi:hypothetical protein